MSEAAGPATDALFTRFVCRVSGAPADTVDGMRADRALELLRQLAEVEARLSATREDVSQRLFTAIGAAQEKPARNKLITLKRELYNFKPQPAERLDAALASVEPETAAAVHAFAADVQAARALEGELRQAHDQAAAQARGQFREQITDADFRKGLMVSSRALYGNLQRYAAAAESGDLSGRDEKTERGLLRYYTRMAMKATPFATFCAIIPGTFVEGEPGGIEGQTRFTGDPRAKRSFVRINKFLYGLLFDHLKTRAAFRHALAVERNPTLRSEGPRLVFLTSIDGREVFQRLADNEVLQLIASRFADGGAPTLGELIRALSSDPEIDATPEEAEAYLDKLIEIGFLRFHTGIREQDADWDLPFRALLDRIDDDHARRSSTLLAHLRERVEAYTDAGVQERSAIIEQIHADIEEALDVMEVTARLRKDMPFYEDATSAAGAQIALTPGVRRAFGSFEEWVRATSRLAWPRAEQAGMRHFFETYYESAQGVPLLKFYEDFYREHFKAHVEKEGKQRAGARKEELEGYDVGNPFGLESIKDLGAARVRLTEVFRRLWDANRDAETIDVPAEEVDEALRGVETLSGVPRSMGAFGLLVQAESEGADPTFLLHGSSYTAGYGKYFSRFLYMLPDDVQEDVRQANAALTGEMLAEICGDAQFNANLHPPLLKWEISYPTGESGNSDEQLRSSEILVVPDPEDPQSLALFHGPTRRRVIPVDLGFLNPRMRPPLYQLLSRFTPPVMYAPTIPESAEAPRQPQPQADQPAAEANAAQAEGVTVQPAAAENAADAQPIGDAQQPVAEARPAEVQQPAADGQPAEGQPAAEGQAGDGQAAEGQQAPAAPAMPAPTINYRPRITYGGGRLVLSRRRWVVPGVLFPQRRADESAADFFIRANRWRAENGIPETAYLRVIPVPEARPAQPGQPAGEQTPVEAAGEIPGYEGGAPEAEAHEEEHDAPEAAAAPDAGAEAAAQDGAPTDPEAAAKAAEVAKKRTQPSKDFFKPQFMDFGNPLLVGLLGRIATGLKGYQAVFEERYPDRDALPRHGEDRFVTELVVQLYFPGGTASAPAEAGALAEAAPGA
ncbi:lantibiotic dehydratase [Longimicrobium sp.]|uniref:lantibiotic dehydratase n=1 Tax=Longimicrobium sp. TaxID=2029185 RepID=UPI002E342B06|nr:lantibiotic dehydratase [Longimicrobium sp.]